MKKTTLLLLTAGLAVASAGAQNRLSFNGYFKNFSILMIPPSTTVGNSLEDQSDMGAANNRVRLKMSFQPSDGISFDLSYDISPRIQDSRLFTESPILSGFRPLEYRAWDFRERLYPGPAEPAHSFGLFHNLDRLSVTLRTDFADIIVGRQAVSWGSARVINPTDVIAPFAFNELDREERRGVDAVRVRIPLGMMDEIDVGYVAGHDLQADESAFFFRGKIYKLKTDISVLAVGFRQHLLVGIDLARAVGGAGAWLEAAWMIPDAFRDSRRPGEKKSVRLSLGLDTILADGLYGFAEYHFNSAGSQRPEQYMELFDSVPYRDGSVYLMGRHYVNVGATYQLHPLVPVTGLVIVNLSDGSWIFSPSAEYNIAENIYLAAGAYVGSGKRPEHVLGPLTTQPLLLHSEFGTYPDMVFTSFRIYF